MLQASPKLISTQGNLNIRFEKEGRGDDYRVEIPESFQLYYEVGKKQQGIQRTLE